MCSAARYSAAAALARATLSPSALLTAIISASSTTPFLRPCSSSPAPGSISTRKKSVMSATLISDWPMPTVSTRTTSNPAASPSSMVSRVLLATPPGGPDAGGGGGGGGGGGDEGGGGAGERRHARLAAEDRPAGAGRRRVDGQHRHLVALAGQAGAEGVDGSRFAHARHAGDADANRPAGR